MPTRAAGQEADPAYAGHPADSLAKYRRSDGSLEPGRQALHDQIVAAALAGHQREAHPVATFLGGGTASGKSTAFPPGSIPGVHMDSDQIKAQLPEYRDMTAAGDLGAASYTHEESSLISRRIKAAAEERGYSFTLDGTGDASYAKMRSKIDAARAAGHLVAGKYVTVDTDEAARRENIRAKETGRKVEERVLRELHAGVTDVLQQLITNDDFDAIELYDNNGSHPVLVGRVMITERGEVAIALGRAAALHQGFPAEVEDTPHNRELFESIREGTEAMEADGIMPEIPAE